MLSPIFVADLLCNVSVSSGLVFETVTFEQETTFDSCNFPNYFLTALADNQLVALPAQITECRYGIHTELNVCLIESPLCQIFEPLARLTDKQKENFQLRGKNLHYLTSPKPEKQYNKYLPFNSMPVKFGAEKYADVFA
ncbi:MAG: hypothetical protein NWF06_06770 [Candidatus Bathyarchaeota archaeon]|nr:hypothetical protein [Candidatus Bathyarchaeum sp.]